MQHLTKFHIKEKSLVYFTLLYQVSVGISLALLISEHVLNLNPVNNVQEYGWGIVALICFAAIVSSFFHLLVPLHAWRSFSNIKSSWLSREICLVSLYFILVSVLAFAPVFNVNVAFILKMFVIILGLAGVYAMSRVYRIKQVGFWNSLNTALHFFFISSIVCCFMLLALNYFLGGLLDFNIWVALLFSFLILWNNYLQYKNLNRLISSGLKIGKSHLFLKNSLLATGVFNLILIVLFGITGELLWFVLAVFPFMGYLLLGRILFFNAQMPHVLYLNQY